MDGLLSNKSEALAESIKDISFKCKMEMENFISTEQYFERKADVKKYTFVYNGKKESKKTPEFYDYLDNWKKHSFQWKDGSISYEVTLPSDEKHLIKKIQT